MRKTAMIYTDELHRLKPLAWVAVTCLGFWAFTFWKFPAWTFIILAAVTGVGLAFVLGDTLNRRVRERRADRELDETLRRKRIQKNLDAMNQGRPDARRRS